jgi:LuxR family maltose regulon positive regulatory protein
MPQQVRELHRRASRWHERNENTPEAIRHALCAQDQERAVQLIEENGCLLLTAGQVITLNEWLQAVGPFVPAHPWLGILQGWVLMLTGQQDQVARVLDGAEHLLDALEPSLQATTNVRIMRGALAAARAHRASAQSDPVAAAFARQALAGLPEGDTLSDSLRSVATLILGDASWISGNLAEAKQAYGEAARIGRAARNPHLVILGNADWAEILIEEGQLQLAAGKLSEALQVGTRADGSRSLWVDRVLAGLSRVAFERNELEAAERYARQCLELCHASGDLEFAAVGQVMLARVAEAQGHPDKALEAMRAAEQLSRECAFSPRLWDWVQCSFARRWITQGNYERVDQFLRKNNIGDDGSISFAQEPMYLVLLRLLLAQREYDPALALTRRLLAPTEAAGRNGRLVEILVHRALAFQGKGDLDQALKTLARALALAEPERAVRVFLDEGAAMARLLFQAKVHHVGTGFVNEVLAAWPKKSDDAARAATLAAQVLPEPLSARELQVLKLIAAGDSNEEIAAKLVISIKTAKRHISNIYGKLGAKSRTQAVALARELKLVE